MASASDYRPIRRLKEILRMTTRIHEDRVSQLKTAAANGVHCPMIASSTDADDIPYPLTKDEAITFLEDVLRIPDPEFLIMNDRLGFVNTYIHRMCTMIPFTNIPHMARRIDAEGAPTFEECKDAIFRRHGGHCYYKNLFSKALLDILGFTTFHVGGNNPGEHLFNTHVGIIMTDLHYPGSLHLIEPGTRRPMFQAIPLDFEEESPIYQFSILTSKFFKKDHGILLWCAYAPEESETSEYVLESEGRFWRVQLIYRLNDRKSRDFFFKMADYRFGIPGVYPAMHQVTFLIGYKGEHIYMMGVQRNAHGMRRSSGVRVDHKDPSECLLEMLSEEEVVDCILENFPQYPRKMVQQAVENTEYGGNLYLL